MNSCLFKIAVASVMTIAASTASAATLAFDNAGQAAYSDGWQNGDNGGSGFQPWQLLSGADPHQLNPELPNGSAFCRCRFAYRQQTQSTKLRIDDRFEPNAASRSDPRFHDAAPSPDNRLKWR